MVPIMPDALSLDHLMKFIDLLNRFRQVRRVVLVNGEDRWENDVEHSYHLAMLAWYTISAEKLPLDAGKAMMYALIHDLVEVYAGDVPLHASPEVRAGKEERERKAALTLQKELPEFSDLHAAITDYTAHADPEAKFVYALDKLQSTLQIYTDNGRTWRRVGTLLSDMIAYKEAKIAVSSPVHAWYDMLIKELRAREPELFPKKA